MVDEDKLELTITHRNWEQMIKLYPNINFLFQNLTQSDVILKQTVRVITFLTVYNRKDSPQ